ncbi:MAG: hypothetical protein QM779_12405 [Propionicimonas sp.]|uniref:TolB family protein n=1 Tax=Propionicimonas sp. TaxID=1955623 RepID=UPI003D0C7138
MARGKPGGWFRPLVAGGLLVTVAWSACPGLASADWLGNERMVTAGGTTEQWPQLSGSRVVYTAVDSSSGQDVRVRDLATGADRVLTPDHSATGRAAISGSRVVWTDATGVRYVNLDAADAPLLLAAGATDPSIAGTRVCYTAADRIHVYNLRTGADRVVSPATASAATCDISGDVVVWADDRTGAAQVYALDLATDVETPVTSTPSQPSGPRVDDGLVVWQDGDGVYALDLATQERTTVATAAGARSTPEVSDGRIVWADGRFGHGDTEVFLYDVASGVEVQVTRGDGWTGSPTISGTRVLYADAVAGGTRLVQRSITPPRLVVGLGAIDETGGKGVTGRLTGTGAVPVVGVDVTLESSPDGSTWTDAATVVTAGDGSFEFALPAGQDATHLRVRFASTPDFAPAVSRELVDAG